MTPTILVVLASGLIKQKCLAATAKVFLHSCRISTVRPSDQNSLTNPQIPQLSNRHSYKEYFTCKCVQPIGQSEFVIRTVSRTVLIVELRCLAAKRIGFY